MLTRAVEAVILFLPTALLAGVSTPKPGLTNPLFLLVLTYFLYNNFLRVNGYLCHSNLTTDYGWVGRWLLVSPRMHRLHHAAAPEYHDRNFSFDLVLWDRLFGTYASCEESALPKVPLGLSENPFENGGTVKGLLLDYFVTPYTQLWESVRRDGRKAWLPPARAS
jgi:sterol desaturase/sphingolipid hydroxylase (fatty acid hydroxylase superfamily)